MRLLLRLLAVLLGPAMWLPSDGKPVNMAFTGKQTTTLSVDNLLCENLQEPIAIDNTCPHFSWMNHSNHQNDTQTAYEIEIASTPKLLQRGKADIWKSGKVARSESVMVPYNGQTLQQRHIYYWRVRTWNKYNGCTGWSKIHRMERTSRATI